MKEDKKDEMGKQNVNEEENNEDFLQIDNLNINDEVDIKENPKKHIANIKKKQILMNSIDDNCKDTSENISTSKQNKAIKSEKRRITYDDIYLGNEMFIIRSKSLPKDSEKNNKYLNNFLKIYYKHYHTNSINSSTSNNSNSNNNSNSTNNISNISIGDEEEYDEEEPGLLRSNSYEYFGKKKESTHLKDFLISINNHRKNIYENIFDEDDKVYVDEDEKKNENIFCIENEKELNNLNYYSKKNKCKISYITLNLFIKKLCTENLKNDYPILYKSFINQYQEFYSIPALIEKIIEAINYYTKKINIEIPEPISLLNKIISNHFKKIEDNNELIEKLKTLYNEFKDISWINESLKKEIENVNFILTSSNNDNEFDLEHTRLLLADRKKSKAISIRSRTKAKVLNNKAVYKYPYFYIFDFSDEEIARNLTLISYKMLSCININELWNNNFSKDDKYIKAPNVMKLIDRFNKLMLFIIEDISSYETNKARAKLITKWANIAKRCKDLHNYNDLLIINQCFNHYLLKKMISAWKKLSKSTLSLIDELNKFCTNQQCYINIRREIVGCKHIAYIPYLGILLKEIDDIENKYKYMERFGEYNCINCIKIQKIYWVVNKFFEFKNYSFTFTQINDLNILNQLNPRTKEEIECMINNNEKNTSTFKELKEFIQNGNKKKPTKSDELFYC